MDILTSSNIYDWFASLIRRRSKRNLTDETTLSTLSNVEVQFPNEDETEIQHATSELNSSHGAQIINNIRKKIQTSNLENISLKMDDESKSQGKSDDNTIEEEIEEVASDVLSESKSNESEAVKNLADVNVIKKRQLFDIDDDKDAFMFDDDQLSGGNLAQHFNVQEQKSDSKKPSSNKVTSGSEHEQNFDPASLTNQSTTHDISELVDEISEEQQELGTRSLIEMGAIANNVNYDKRGCRSLEMAVNYIKLPDNDKNLHEDKTRHEGSNDKDNSLDEIMESNYSVELSLGGKNQTSSEPIADVNNETQINKIVTDTVTGDTNSKVSNEEHSLSSSKTHETDENMEGALQRKGSPISTAGPVELSDITFDQSEDHAMPVKQMERIQFNYSKEILENITEESEKHSTLQEDIDKTLNDFDSIMSLNKIQMLENQVKDLENIVSSKDMESLNLDSGQRRESYATLDKRDSLKELPPSGRDSSSLATTSTEYQTIKDEYMAKVYDFHSELMQRDTIIEKLRESLAKSLETREQDKYLNEKLAQEVQQLRKQLTDAIDTFRDTDWPRQDHESTGQRISETSLDLVSESDEDLDRNFLTDNEDNHIITTNKDKNSRNSKERQLYGSESTIEIYEREEFIPISKQMDQFKKYLNADEYRIFFMVEKKFDDFLCQEIEKIKMKCDNEMKGQLQQLENDKQQKDEEIKNLRQLLDSTKGGTAEITQLRLEHQKEMEDLRTYFEKKCADMEKQYSEEVFSQKSQHNSNNTNSDLSDQENFPEENIRSKESTPRRRTRVELYSSPSHRQITPTLSQPNEPDITKDELESFYKDKIHEIQNKYDEKVKKLREKLKRFELKYADDEFMIQEKDSNDDDEEEVINKGSVEPSSYLCVDEDDGEKLQKFFAEYEARLHQQVASAREDVIQELGNRIQALLSETAIDDQHWPPELILLREKFTAQSQLEIAQLQSKHAEEMSRLKADYEKQLHRKLKRNSLFDNGRDLNEIVNDRENLRELSGTLRWILSELAKCVSFYENDLNITLAEELHKLTSNQLNQTDETIVDNEEDIDINNSRLMNVSTLSTNLHTTLSQRLRFVPDVSSLLSVIEDPSLLDYITKTNGESVSFNLKICLEKLRTEANYLLELSEDICKKRKLSDNKSEKNDSCEEEDGLKSGMNRTPQKVSRAGSFNENLLRDNQGRAKQNLLQSLPPDLNRITLCSESIIEDGGGTYSTGTASEVNFQVHELKNRLVKSENDKQKLQQELDLTIKKNNELSLEIKALKEQIDTQREDYSEGYGIGDIKSPQRIRNSKNFTSFAQLQDRARNILSTPTKMGDNTSMLLHMIEDFCREGDKVVEEGKKDREDLQAQIEVADKQLKSIRQFLEEQATEREFERDEFSKEIESLKNQIREKEKEKNTYEIASKEITNLIRIKRKMEQMELQIKELTQQITEYDIKKEKLETELKASIDKVFDLREIITDLETQVQTKAINEQVLKEKVKELEYFITSQSRSNDAMQQELESLKSEIGQGYQEKISHLEEQLRNSRANAEESLILGQVCEQLRDIEITLEQKIKILENIHQSTYSVSGSTSHTEDVSVPLHNNQVNFNPSPQGSPIHVPPKHSLPIEEIQRVLDKLSKHTRVEEAAIKRIRDLDMQVYSLKATAMELQNERDSLQERFSEQVTRIASLQSKLEEQRRRAEELQRQGTTDLNIRIHDLQSEVQNLKETLSARDKQLNNLKNQLEQSKTIIDRQEAELALGIQSDRSAMEKIENELKSKLEENKKLKEKIKKEMISKLALPDLMETMLADKNEEIDHLKEQLESKEKELQGLLEINLSQINNTTGKGQSKELTGEDADNNNKLSARTLSDIGSISEFDEPEALRRAANKTETPLVLPHEKTLIPNQTMETPKNRAPPQHQSEKETGEVTLFGGVHPPCQPVNTFGKPHYFQDLSFPRDGLTSGFVPRHINFSECADSTPKIQEIFDSSEEIKILKEQLTNAERSVESLKISLETIENEKQNEIDKLKEEIEAKIKAYNDIIKENENLKADNKAAAKNESELLAKNAEISKLKNEVKEINAKLENLQEELNLKNSRIDNLQEAILKITVENDFLAQQLQASSEDKTEEVNKLTQEILKINKLIKEKDELLTKNEKNLINLQQNEKDHLKYIETLEERIKQKSSSNDEVSLLQKELESLRLELDSNRAELNLTRADLSAKVILYEKSLLDIQALEDEIKKLKEILKDKNNIITSMSTDSKSLQDIILSIQKRLDDNDSLNELKRLYKEEQERNKELQQKTTSLERELEKLRSPQNSDNSKPFSLDEIAEQVEKELNYSAQLDSNILKAIESEEENNLDTHFKTDNEKLIERDLQNQLQNLNTQLDNEKRNSAQIQLLLDKERQHSEEIQQQDAQVIEAIKLRLEDALKNEEALNKALDDEREKYNRLATQLSVLQRAEARKSSLLLKSPPDSPRKSPRSNDFESELAERLRSEIKMLTAQNERERERIVDLQKVLEREKSRFETELNDRIEYGERLKKEMDKLSRDKDIAEQEVEHLQERLTLSAGEIESLETRIAILQEAETRRTQRRDRERTETIQNAVDLQDLKSKLATAEIEKDHLNQTIATLRSDLERGAQREAKLAEALANTNGETSIPEQFMQKIKEINTFLAENTKENRQMADTVYFLIEERKSLQKKCEKLEQELNGQNNYTELEERANHLFGRYLRVESHRKALVHQKRYLLIVLKTYEENENKALAMINGGIRRPHKRNLFKTVGLMIIAIHRMKFIVKRWQTGKRIISKSIFNAPIQKRSSPTGPTGPTPISMSPPSHDTSHVRGFSLVNNPNRPLQAPGLISECSQKFDWSRLKK